MRNIIIFLLSFLPLTLFAQNEISVNLGSGLFLFGRYYANDVNIVIINRDFKTGYTSNTYNSSPGISYNFSIDYKRVTNNKLVFGAELGYDYLRSINKIDYALNYFGWEIKSEPTKTVFICNDLYFSPVFGKRFEENKWQFDLTAGVDVAYLFNAKDKGVLITNEREKVAIDINNDVKINNRNNLDFRPKLKVAAFYKNTGAFLSYSHGISNFAQKVDNSDFSAYSRLIKFGLSYRFVKI